MGQQEATPSQPNSSRQLAVLPTSPAAPIAPLKGSSFKSSARDNSSLVSDLADLLGAIPEMAELTFRERIYAGVPRDVMQQVRRSEKARLDLLSVAETFETYAHLNPWSALLRQLQRYLPGNPHVAKLEARLRELGLAGENDAL